MAIQLTYFGPTRIRGKAMSVASLSLDTKACRFGCDPSDLSHNFFRHKADGLTVGYGANVSPALTSTSSFQGPVAATREVQQCFSPSSHHRRPISGVVRSKSRHNPGYLATCPRITHPNCGAQTGLAGIVTSSADDGILFGGACMRL